MDLLLSTIFFLYYGSYFVISYYLLDIVYRRTIEIDVDIIFLKDNSFFSQEARGKEVSLRCQAGLGLGSNFS